MQSFDSKRKTGLGGFLSRLRHDVAGNAMMMVAGAAVPLLAGVGVAVDMGRLYATNAKLQSACDAAVLGGRKAMTANSWTAQTKNVADNFFANNFPTGKYGSTNESITYTAAASGEVSAVAKAKLPMMIMQMFGAANKDLQATCKAQLNMGNTDVMFVLDTTGSMMENDSSGSMTRMDAMKAAVTNFHTTLENAKAASVVSRYGFVPYANNVSVGYLLDEDWMVDSWTYQSRVAAGTGTSGSAASTQDVWSETEVSGGWPTPTYTDFPLEPCDQNDSYSHTSSDVEDPSSVTFTPNPDPSLADVRTSTITRTWGGSYFQWDKTPTQCRKRTYNLDGHVQILQRKITPTKVGGSSTTTYNWDYRPVTFNVSALKGLTSGGSITTATGSNHTNRTINWEGCIEERATVREDDYSTMPVGAYDMDIDRVPDSDETRWKPALPQLVYSRGSFDTPSQWSVAPKNGIAGDAYWNVGDKDGGKWATCPSQAKKLTPMTATDITNYLGTLVAKGSTYHDIGMVWGARLLSPTGLFASENATATNGGTISRNLIFMTDGLTDTSPMVYDAYGWPALDRRRQMDVNTPPTKADQDGLVEERLAALCAAAKAKGMTVWVVAFGVTATTTMNNCASNGAAYSTASATQLNDAFASIANNIAGLRLTR